jgi:hypothetical protein
MNTRSNFSAASSASERSAGSKAWASTPGLQGLQHAGAGHDRDVALGRTAAEQDADLAELGGVRVAHDDTF